MPDGPGALAPRMLAIGLLSAALLQYEVLLTRACSLQYWYHWGFLVVSLGMLGLAASGTWLARHPTAAVGDRIPTWCAAFLVALAVAWTGLGLPPVREDLVSPAGLARFALLQGLTALPFFAGGVAVGQILASHARRASLVYGADLIGAATGCAATPWLLPRVGAGGCLAVSASLGALALVLTSRGRARAGALLTLVLAVSLVPGLDRAFPLPGKDPRTPAWSAWTAAGRVDLVPVAGDQRVLYGLGRNHTGAPVPAQYEILQDGSAATYVTDFGGDPAAADLLDASLYTAALRLPPSPRVLVIGGGGGNDVWAALRYARSVRAVELHAPTLRLHREVLFTWTAPLWDPTRVTWVHAEGRSALLRDPDRYEVVQLTGVDTWAALSSGAWVLSESWLYTREALEAMLDHLAPGGVLQVVRMAAEMETLRLLATERVALEAGAGNAQVPFADAVAALGSPDHQVATLVKPAGFSAADVQALRDLAETAGLDVLYLPGDPRNDLVAALCTTPDLPSFVDAFPRNIAPVDDDRPYFFHFTRWTRPAQAVSSLREPTYISQGNPAFLLLQLLLVLAVALAVVVAPLRKSFTGPDAPSARSLGWLVLVGAGFMGVEVGLLPRLSLLLGHPVLGLAVTLGTLLTASGVGSLLSGRIDLSLRGGLGLALGIGLLVTAVIVGLAPTIRWTAAWPLAARVACAVVFVAPLGLLLGLPFAWSLRRVWHPAEPGAPDRVPLAWAVNGTASVVGAILAAMASIQLGTAATLALAAGCYLVAAFLTPSPGRAGEVYRDTSMLPS